MVSSLAKVAPGIVIHTGLLVLPGKYIQSQAEADDPSLGKVTAVTDGDLQFIDDVIHVNEVLAEGYTEQKRQLPSSVRGIGPNPAAPHPGPIPIPPRRPLRASRAPSFPSRIIGDV